MQYANTSLCGCHDETRSHDYFRLPSTQHRLLNSEFQVSSLLVSGLLIKTDSAPILTDMFFWSSPCTSMSFTLISQFKVEKQAKNCCHHHHSCPEKGKVIGFPGTLFFQAESVLRPSRREKGPAVWVGVNHYINLAVYGKTSP